MNNCLIKKSKIFLLFIILFLSIPFNIAAEEATAYIDDIKYVPLRSGYSIKNRILAPAIKSGTEIKILKHDKKSGFTKVVIPDGTIGWLQTQHLTTTPISKQKLEKLEIDYLNLSNQFNELNSIIENLKNDKEKAELISISLEEKNKILNEEISEIKKIASNAINLDLSNRKLIEKNETLKIEIAELQSDNARLADNSDKEWFLRGALAVLIGVILTVTLPKLKPKSRAKEWL